MVLCDTCWGPNCARTADGTVACNCPDFIAVIQTARQANGVYNNAFRSLLPATVRDISDNVVDAARGYVAPGLTVLGMSAAATTLYNGGNQVQIAAGPPVQMGEWYEVIDGGDAAMLANSIEVYENVAGVRAVLLRHMKRLTLIAANAGQRLQCKDTLAIFESFDVKAGKVVDTPKTAGDLEDKKFPLARIYLYVVKGVTASPLSVGSSGGALEKLTTGVFDKANGLLLQEFEKVKLVDDPQDMHEVLRVFLDVMLLIGNNGGRDAWRPIYEQMYSFMRLKTILWCHLFFFEFLKKLDLDKGVCNLGNFLPQYFQSFLMEFEQKWSLRENEDPSLDSHDSEGGSLRYGDGKRGGGAGTDWTKKAQITTPTSRDAADFADITKKGAAGIMLTGAGEIAYCSRWQIRKKCNRAVKGGPKHGKCAYTHACSWCKDGTTSHRGADKGSDGKFVCPNHPANTGGGN